MLRMFTRPLTVLTAYAHIAEEENSGLKAHRKHENFRREGRVNKCHVLEDLESMPPARDECWNLGG